MARTKRGLPITDPAHPNHRSHRSVCKQIVEIRSQVGPEGFTEKQQARLAHLIAERDALHTPPATAPKPQVRHIGSATGRPRTRHLTKRIEFRCERCRKDCWTLETHRRYCDACRERMLAKNVRKKPGRTSRWISVVPSGIPGSGVRA